MREEIQEIIILQIKEERLRQNEKWGEDRHLSPLLWNAILTEEVGEVAKEVLEKCPSLRDELIQVAAVALAWLEDIDNNNCFHFEE